MARRVVKRKSNSKKVNKSEYLQNVAKRTGMSLDDVFDVFDAMVDELVEVARSKRKLSLTGVGLFYVQQHKGHPVQFAGSSEKVSDYEVLKFSASDVMNKKLRDNDPELISNVASDE